jgi:lysophospholipase L1-like esterase
MLECLIVGDSIAVGTAHFRPECAVMAKSGINSQDWNKKHFHDQVKSDTVIISLGSNDLKTLHTFKEVIALRQRVQASRVFWILPANKPEKAELIRMVAESYHDTVLPINKLSKDRVHPTMQGYRELANSTR